MRWLLDEMLPQAAAAELERLGHDAISVTEIDLAGADDDAVFRLAVTQKRIVVTENFADFAGILEQRQRTDDAIVPVVFVRKTSFPPGGALASHLAKHLHRWAEQNPDPYEGFHWP